MTKILFAFLDAIDIHVFPSASYAMPNVSYKGKVNHNIYSAKISALL